MVRSIAWSEDDTSFVSCGADGRVNCWKLTQTEADIDRGEL